MHVKHAVEREDGTVVFQGVLEGQELAFVIEMGLEAVIRAGISPFISTTDRQMHDIHESPEQEQ
jgi:hypothetical protein